MSYKDSLIRTLTTSLSTQAMGGNLITEYAAPAMSDSRIGISLPQFKQIIANGGNATTPFIGKKYSAKLLSRGHAKATYQLGSSPYWELIEGCHPQINFVPTHPHNPNNFLADVDREALTRFTKAVRKAQTQISGPTFLGELRETISLFRHPTEAIFKQLSRYLDRVYRSSRRGRRKKRPSAREITRIAADEWLVTQLALGPLISDAEDIARAIARMINEIRHMVVRGYAKTAVKYSERTSWTQANYWRGNSYRSAIEEVLVVYRGGLHAAIYDAPYGALSNLQRIFGFTKQEFIPTIWELIPFSFVVDYFVNVGDLIMFANTDFSSVKWMSRTQRFHTEWSNYSIMDTSNPSQLKSWEGGLELGSTFLTVTDVTRSVVSPYFLSLPAYFSLPGNAVKWANMAALLVARSRGIQNGP